MKERPAGKPFCFWLGFKEPHRPYEDGAGERGGKDLKSVEIPKYYPDHRIVRSDLADYAYECEHMDSHVKKVLDYLESVGELDNTLVVYTSDHGMPFPRVKGQIYEHGYNVPMGSQMLLSNPLVEDHTMVLSWFSYKRGIGNSNYGLGTAIGVFQSAVSVTLLLIANKIAGLVGEDKLM